MKAIKIILLLVGIGLFVSNRSEAGNNGCVILLHGLARTNHSMFKLASLLKKHHYVVVNRNYPSTRKSIDSLANEFISPMVDDCLTHHARHIHFVTHSLGGIILQQYLQKHRIVGLDTIVMLAPPNHGSPLADKLHPNWIFRFFLGPSLAELTTTKRHPSMIHGQYKIGIIAGNYHLNPFSNLIFAEPNDGKVAVSSTKLERMDDFIILPVTHTFIMQNAFVEKQILYFLTHAHFMHSHKV